MHRSKLVYFLFYFPLETTKVRLGLDLCLLLATKIHNIDKENFTIYYYNHLYIPTNEFKNKHCFGRWPNFLCPPWKTFSGQVSHIQSSKTNIPYILSFVQPSKSNGILKQPKSLTKPWIITTTNNTSHVGREMTFTSVIHTR